MFLVRSSKFRHVYGSPLKKELCYEGVKLTRSAHDGCFCAVNPKYLAVVTESAGGGVFLVLPLEQTGRIVANYAPRVVGHRGPVTDIKWSPFDDQVIASASEDTTIKVWRIPDGGLVGSLADWLVDLQGHTKKCSYIEWHPTAEGVLLSAGADFQCIVWNTKTGEKVRSISVHSDTIFSISWNRTGSLFATTCKDKNIRVIDALQGTVVSQGVGHSGAKTSKVVFIDDHRLFTCGFSRMSERQFAIWDTKNLSQALKLESIDSSSGTIMPFYDHDTRVMYLAGKGDGNIRFYEIVRESPYIHFLNQYMSGNPQRGFGFMPKRGVNTERCEIFRFYKLHSLKDLCEPLSMIVPRKSEQYQDDIYPPTIGLRPAVTTEEWLSGVTREPYLISLKDGKPATASPIKEPVQPQQKKSIKVYNPLNAAGSAGIEKDANESTSEPKRLISSSSVSDEANVGGPRLPASVLNIQRLSSVESETNKDSVSSRLQAYESRSTSAHNGAATHSPVESSKIDRRVLSSGYVALSEKNSGSGARSEQEHDIASMKALIKDSSKMAETELRKAYHMQIEEIFGLKEQLMGKEKRIRQLEDEVRLLRASHPNKLSNSSTS